MRVKNVLMLMMALILGLVLHAGAVDSELRVKFGVLSHWDNLFGNLGFVVGSDYLIYLEDSPFGIAGGLEYISSARTTFYSGSTWRDIVTTLSFLYFPIREVYLGMGLEYHWITEEETYRYTNWHNTRKDSGLGLHFVVGFNLGKHIFLEGKINSVGIGYSNKGGISLRLGSRF